MEENLYKPQQIISTFIPMIYCIDKEEVRQMYSYKVSDYGHLIYKKRTLI